MGRRIGRRGETRTRRTLQQPVTNCLGTVVLLVVSTALIGSPAGGTPDEKKNKTEPGTATKADEQAR